ncbi:PREDICTED: acyl-coenzyme A thioesterase THEM5 isoform X2 [Hipposideros armiger]|uniref:palmitoyl-CoA hydrolase n=1 Tax=Hipposideros armiger TaxID=186990 RepID=A0A8B7Q6T4_HIPAR|nr:PREDICTED: acyl-coenzyme A thioesterase THEM5 isoform X2 [Hipposideros armiger]
MHKPRSSMLLIVSPILFLSFLCALAFLLKPPKESPNPLQGRRAISLKSTLVEGVEKPKNAGTHQLEVPPPKQQSPPHPTPPPGSCLVSPNFPAQVSRFCPEKTDLKDYALPNASWCPDMLSLYQEFLEKTKADGWIKLPSFKSNRDHIQGLKLPSGLAVTSDKSEWRIFTRCIQVDGQGYEYVIFFHPSKKKSVCLFQPGPYLEGAPGFAHGGSLAAMMDETFSKTAYLAGEGLFTLNLSIRFKNLIPVGSLAVLNVDVEKIEDQKLYMSCVAQSKDQQTVYAKSSGIFLQLQLEEESSQ